MPGSDPSELRRQVVELAGSGTRVAVLADTFGMSAVSIYHWLKQDRIDRGEELGQTTDQQLELAAAKRRIARLETRVGGRSEGQRGVLDGGHQPKRLFPVIDSLTGQGFSVRHACRTLGVSESGYYAWKDRPDPPRQLRRIWLAGEIADVHKASGGTYGAHRVTAELNTAAASRSGITRSSWSMRELGIRGTPTRRLPKGARVAKVTSLDLVRRVFARDRPNALWVTDITEHPTNEGKVYCCVVLDTFSRLVAGWSIDSTQTTSLVLNALGMATQRRRDRDGLIVHSDRGTQFSSWALEQPAQRQWDRSVDGRGRRRG
jgi:putative transposase